MSAEVDQRIRPTAFLAAPISDNYDRVKGELRKSLGESGIHTTFVDELQTGANISDQILEAILQSDFVIADITGANPNVMYELGFARAARIPILPIVQAASGDPSVIPASVSGLYYLIYDPSNITDLGKKIRNWFAHRAHAVAAR